MARKIEVEILGDSSSLERAFLRSSKAGSSFSSGISKAALAGGAAIAGFSVAAVKGIQAASNLNEEVNKTEVVFGRSAAGIQAWSKTTADALGLSRRAALEAAGGFGLMLQTAGLNEKSTADMSKRLVGLAADLASFNNIDPTEALDKLRSGLAGEAEPLRRLGVFLSEARVQGEAYRLGIAKQGDELTEAQKIQARYSLILQDTTKAQGDFARTSDEFANSQRRVRAQLEDAAAAISSKILPAVADAVSGFAGFIQDFSEARTIEAKFDVVVSNVREIAGSMADQIENAVAAIDWGNVFERASGFAEGLQARVEEIDFGFVGEEIGNAFSNAAKVALPAAKDLAGTIAQTVRDIDFEDLGKQMGPGLAAAVATAFATLLDPAFWVRNWDLALAIGLAAFSGPIGRFAGRLGGLLVSGIARGLGRIAPELGAAFRGLALQAVRLFGAGLEGVVALTRRLLQPLAGIVSGVFSRLGRLATFTVKVLGIQAVIDAIGDLASGVASGVAEIPSLIGDAFSSGFDFVIRKALEFVEKLLGITSILGPFDPFKGLRESVQRRLEEMREDVKTTAKDVNDSLAGIKDRKVTIAVETRIGGEGPGAGETANVGAPDRAPSEVAKRITGSLDAIVKAFKDAADAGVKKGRAQVEAAKKAFPDLIAAMELNLDRASATAGFSDDLRLLDQIEAAIREEIRVEGNTSELARQLFETRQKRAAILEQRSDASKQAFSDAIAAIGLDVSRAEATKGLQDDLDANAELQSAISARIKTEGRTTELLEMLFDATEKRKRINAQIRENARAATQSAQFRALGLTGAGDEKIPTIANLQKQLGSLEQNVKGTVLDTSKNRTLFEQARKVLAGQWGKATEETRSKIREFFQTIRGELNSQEKKGDLTPKIHALDTSKIVSGLNLDANTVRELRGRLAGFTTAGAALAGAGGTVSRTTAGATVSPGGFGNLSFAFDLYIDGEPVAASVVPRIQKRNNRTPALARGRNPGRRGI